MSELNSIDKEISKLGQDLNKVLSELEELKKRQEKNSKAKTEALLFLEKAEKVIALLEKGKVTITQEQYKTIYNALLKIRKLFRES